jgi:hypothetical protein
MSEWPAPPAVRRALAPGERKRRQGVCSPEAVDEDQDLRWIGGAPKRWSAALIPREEGNERCATRARAYLGWA